jgi:prolyl 4-hydroxylase
MEIAKGIYTIPEFFTPAECDGWIALSERVGFEAATLATMGGPELQKDIRNNDRVILDDHDRACELWRKLEPAVPRILEGRQAVGLNERLRFYRYDPGQQFRGHVDAPYRRENGQSSILTFLVYLNDGYDGEKPNLMTWW